MKTQILRSLALCSSFLIIGCTQKHNTLTSKESDQGWTLLFDGESLNGWRGYMDNVMELSWSVQNGELTLKGGNPKGSYANIRTEAEFDDFELTWEWKIEAGSNTGLMFHVKEGPKMPYLTGPEYQMLDNVGFRGGNGNPVPPNEFTATHYAIEEAYQNASNPIGMWNSSRIFVRGNSVEYWLNGVKTAAYEMHSEKWKEQVAAAKFGKWKLYGTTGEGYFALQDHGHGAAFRNIKVRKL